MKKFAIVLMAIALLAGTASADSKPALEKNEVMAVINASLTEVEPNDTPATGNPIAGGDDYAANISAGTDVDYFTFTTTGGAATFETSAGAAPAIGDTKIYIYGTDGTTQIGYDDDAGVGYYSLVNYNFTVPGTYYIKVIGYSASYTGNYVLTCTAVAPPPPPAVNDVCEGAIDIQDQSLASWDVALNPAGGFNNNYSLTSADCTGYTTPGPDAVFMIDLAAGEEIMVSEIGACDTALWISSDCANLMTSCVVGADDALAGAAETVSYTAVTAGTYYVVVDSYTAAGCPVTVTINAPVATEESSFGALKAMFR
jgi:hypothetical protein